ncbi:hypothetical protein JCM16303_004229 [Sporobolomyces ruberrimus]
MPRSTTYAALFAAFSSLAIAAPEVGSPNIYECSPVAIQYTCDKTPCTIIARPADDAATSLENFGSVNDASGSVSWRPVNQKAGSVVVLYINNADGEQATSARLTVNSPNDSSNTLGSNGQCSASSSDDGDSSSSSAAGSSTGTSTGAGAAASSVASDASSKASEAAGSATSKAGSITSKIADATNTADNASQTDGGSGAAGVFVKSSLVTAAVLAVGSALF